MEGSAYQPELEDGALPESSEPEVKAEESRDEAIVRLGATFTAGGLSVVEFDMLTDWHRGLRRFVAVKDNV